MKLSLFITINVHIQVVIRELQASVINKQGVKELISFTQNPNGTSKYENTLQYAVLKKEWELT